MSARSEQRRISEATPQQKISNDEPYKQITCDNLRRLCRDLPPKALKVWLFHLALSNSGDFSWPTLKTVAAGTTQNAETVKIARKWLRQNGWLDLVGYHRPGTRSEIPKLKCVFPGPLASENPTSVRSRLKAEKPTSVFPPTEVDSVSSEVRSPLPPEADPQLAFGMMQTEVISIGSLQKTYADRSAAGLWAKVLNEIRQSTNAHTFSSWLAPSCGESIRDGCLTVRVPAPIFAKRLREKFLPTMLAALSRAGEQSVTRLEFVASEKYVPGEKSVTLPGAQARVSRR